MIIVVHREHYLEVHGIDNRVLHLYPCFKCRRICEADNQPACDSCLENNDFTCCNCGKSSLKCSENEVCFAWLRCWCNDCWEVEWVRRGFELSA